MFRACVSFGGVAAGFGAASGLLNAGAFVASANETAAASKPASSGSDGKPMVEVIFLGTGSSVSVPSLKCLLGGGTPCTVCKGAAADPQDKNRRGNPSLMLRVPTSPADVRDGESVAPSHRNVLIDCGKTFREASMRIFGEHDIRTIDSVVLTHYHADACFGLDDLRDFSRVLAPSTFSTKPGVATATRLATIPVYCDGVTLEKVKGPFPYLFPAKEKSEARFVSAIDWRKMDGLSTHVVDGLPIKTLPVEHGFDCECYGYEVASKDARFVYLSDVSRIPEATLRALTEGPPIDVLVVDALFKVRRHTTHFSLPQALDCARQLRARRTLLTGMSHEFDYVPDNEELRKLRDSEGLDVQMAYDGLTLKMPLLSEV